MTFTQSILHKTFVALVFCLGISFAGFSQSVVTGKIIDKETKLPIAFASVVYQKHTIQKGVITDALGKFDIKEGGVSAFTVSCLGYQQGKWSYSTGANTSNIVIELEPYAKELNEVKVTPAANPALRIIKQAKKNRRINNFEQYDAYSYRCYVKTIIDIRLPVNATRQDSLAISRKGELKRRAGFVSESVIASLHNGRGTEHKIVAQKTSGFKDPLLPQVFTSVFHHSISFYNNSVALFELPIGRDKSVTEYVGPLSEGCLSGYNYELEDSYPSNADTVFVINFFPKKGKNFSALKGKLFINSNGYAIQHIVVEPYEKGLIAFKFKQDYELIQNKWFPVALDEEVGWVQQRIDPKVNAYPAYLITSKIDNISFDPLLEKANVNREKVYLDEISIRKSDSILSVVRKDSLTQRERNTFVYVDSIGKRHHLDFWFNLLPQLEAGKIAIGKFDLDLNRLYTRNSYEGARFGIGLHTNDQLSKIAAIGGFVGYGRKDEQLKYGGDLLFKIDKPNDIRLKFSYQNNLKEVGRDIEEEEDVSKKMLSRDYLRNKIGYRFDQSIEQKAELSVRPIRYLKLSAAALLRSLSPQYAYSYQGQTLKEYLSDELQFSATYALGENISTLAGRKILNFEGNPVLNLIYRRGVTLFHAQSYSYNRMEAGMDATLYNGRIGQSNISLAAGYIDRSLPYGLLFTGDGSKNSEVPLLISKTFQTMSPYEFLSDKYVNLFYAHNFGSLLFKTKTFKPQFVVMQNSGWGSLRNPAFQGIDFKQMNKIYLESGLVINNIVRVNFLNMFYLGFGAGAFYRYGDYGYNRFKDNIALKISISVSLK